MSTLSAKITDIFRNLKSDAVPRAPRSPRTRNVEPEDIPTGENNENYNTTNGTDDPEEPEVIVIEEPDDDLKKEKKPKVKIPFFKSKSKEEKPKKQEKSDKRKSDGCVVNTQSTGNVINIVKSKDVRWGNDYYMGFSKPKSKVDEEPEEEVVEKCNDITMLMEAKVKPEHEYMDFISNNLGKNWYGFYIKLGFLKGRIETMEINTREYGVNEARYKLLLDWVRNDKQATLGCLATKLWEHGDRELVKHLALLYKKNNYK